MEHSENKIIIQSGLFENEVGPGVFQYSIQQTCMHQKNAKGKKFRPLKVSEFCVSYLEIFQNIFLLNTGMKHSRSILVLNTLYLIFEILYSMQYLENPFSFQTLFKFRNPSARSGEILTGRIDLLHRAFGEKYEKRGECILHILPDNDRQSGYLSNTIQNYVPLFNALWDSISVPSASSIFSRISGSIFEIKRCLEAEKILQILYRIDLWIFASVSFTFMWNFSVILIFWNFGSWKTPYEICFRNFLYWYNNSTLYLFRDKVWSVQPFPVSKIYRAFRKWHSFPPRHQVCFLTLIDTEIESKYPGGWEWEWEEISYSNPFHQFGKFSSKKKLPKRSFSSCKISTFEAVCS